MLTQLSTVKTRLALTVTDYDGILTNAIQAISTRFDKETKRTLARTTTATHEFDPSDTEVSPPCYPIESVTKFEVKSYETDGWIEQTGVQYLIRRQCVISLSSPLRTPNSALCTARLTYAAGYVLPGTTPGAGQTPLPDDLEQAAVEQVAYWLQNWTIARKKEETFLRENPSKFAKKQALFINGPFELGFERFHPRARPSLRGFC